MTLWPGLPTAGLRGLAFWDELQQDLHLSVWKKVVKLLKENKTSVIAIGRVMTCVLGLSWTGAGDKNFMPKKHYGITATFLSSVSNLLYKGKWVPQNKKDDKEADDEEKYISREEAEQVIERLKGHPGKIKKLR